MKKPICYLDLDDTLIRRPPEQPLGEAAPGATEFLRFLLRHFEVRWLTMWCADGIMSEEGLGWLESFFGIPRHELRHVRNERGFTITPTTRFKWEAIDFAEAQAGRPFVWLEERLHEIDAEQVERHGFRDCFIECDVTANPHRLAEVRETLVERFSLENDDTTCTHLRLEQSCAG
jgi:hypothetical protein